MREDQCDQHSWGTGRRLRSGCVCVGTGWVRHELSAPAQASPWIVKTKARPRHMKMNHHIWSCCREHETMCSGLLSWAAQTDLPWTKFSVLVFLDCYFPNTASGTTSIVARISVSVDILRRSLCSWLVQSIHGTAPLALCNSFSKQSLDSNGTCRPAEEVGCTHKTTVV